MRTLTARSVAFAEAAKHREYPDSGLSLYWRRTCTVPTQLKRRSREASPQSRNLTMKMTYLLAALLLVSSLATPTTAQERTAKMSIEHRHMAFHIPWRN